MLEHVINNLALALLDTGIVTKSGNLAEEVGIRQSDNSIRKVPAAQLAPFKLSEMVAVTPDDLETVICWWEASATAVLRQTEYLMQLRNECNLLMWINTARLSPPDAATAQRAIVNAVLGAKYLIEDGDPIRGVIVDYSGQVFDERLSKFGWDNPEFQMSMPPYKLASHKFQVTYHVSKSCSPQITTKSKSC